MGRSLPLCWEKIPPKRAVRGSGGLCLLGRRQSLMRRDGVLVAMGDEGSGWGCGR